MSAIDEYSERVMKPAIRTIADQALATLTPREAREFRRLAKKVDAAIRAIAFPKLMKAVKGSSHE